MTDLLFHELMEQRKSDLRSPESRQWFILLKRYYYRLVEEERPDLPKWLFLL